MLPRWWWYLGGVAALFATNLLAVTIPLYLAEAIDALGTASGPSVALRNAAIVAAMGVMVMVVRTVSRVAFLSAVVAERALQCLWRGAGRCAIRAAPGPANRKSA